MSGVLGPSDRSVCGPADVPDLTLVRSARRGGSDVRTAAVHQTSCAENVLTASLGIGRRILDQEFVEALSL